MGFAFPSICIYNDISSSILQVVDPERNSLRYRTLWFLLSSGWKKCSSFKGRWQQAIQVQLVWWGDKTVHRSFELLPTRNRGKQGWKRWKMVEKICFFFFLHLLKITAGQQTMSSQDDHLSRQTFGLLVIWTRHVEVVIGLFLTFCLVRWETWPSLSFFSQSTQPATVPNFILSSWLRMQY